MKYNIKNLELASFLKDGETYISGEEMLKRAREYKALSTKEFAKWLDKNQELIPKKWREYYLVFPEYLLDGGGNRLVACFDWDSESQEWVLGFDWRGGDFYRGDRFVVPRESLDSVSLNTSQPLVSWPLDELIINGVKYRKV